MNSKFIYTEKDAAGCTLEAPDFSQCENCLYNFPDRPIACLVYEDQKPRNIIYKKKPCEKKRTK